MILISIVIISGFLRVNFLNLEKTRMTHRKFENFFKSLKFKFERKKSFKVFLVPKKMS